MTIENKLTPVREAEIRNTQRCYPTPEVGDLLVEIDRLRSAFEREEHEIQQTLGAALGYPRYCDDQVNFPGATEKDGVCTEEHIAATLAMEVAREIVRLKSDLSKAEAHIEHTRRHAELKADEYWEEEYSKAREES